MAILRPAIAAGAMLCAACSSGSSGSSGPSDGGASANQTPDGGGNPAPAGTSDGGAFANTGYFECYSTVQYSGPPPYTTHFCREQTYPAGQGSPTAIKGNCKVTGSSVVSATEVDSTTDHCPPPTTPSISCTGIAEGFGSTTSFWQYDIFAGIDPSAGPTLIAMAEQEVTGNWEYACQTSHGTFSTYFVDLDGGSGEGGAVADAGHD